MRHGKGATGSDPVQKGGRIASKSIPGAMLKIFFHPGVRQFSFCFLFSVRFLFFSLTGQLQKHFNERWKISCCLRKGFYSTPFPQFSRWYRTVKTVCVWDESENKAVKTQLIMDDQNLIYGRNFCELQWRNIVLKGRVIASFSWKYCRCSFRHVHF